MHLLVVSPTLPVPTSGGRTRIFNLVKQLARRHRVSVLSFIQPSEQDMLSELTSHCEHVELSPFEGFRPQGRWQNRIQGWYRILCRHRPRYVDTFPMARLRPRLRELVKKQSFDLAMFDLLHTAELSTEVGDLPMVLVEHNVESDIAKRRYVLAANPMHKLRDWLSWQKLLLYERKWVGRFSVCVAVSEKDATKLREMAPSTDVYVVPNGVDVQHFTPRGTEREVDTLLFFGTLSYGPNRDGLLWFCDEIWPRIRQVRPQAKLDVVGLDPPAAVRELETRPGVRVTGFVPDIRSKLWSATATVVPLRLGGGTRLKILEALAAGCPVVSTTIGAEGLSLADGAHYLLADTAEVFAGRVVDLLGSPELRQMLTERGHRIVKEQHDWSMIARRLESVFQEVVEKPPDGTNR